MNIPEKTTPVTNSIIAYRREIASWQLRHFPCNANQEKIGIMSATRIDFWHFGHREAEPRAVSCGSRQISTFKKLPTLHPIMNNRNMPIHSNIDNTLSRPSLHQSQWHPVGARDHERPARGRLTDLYLVCAGHARRLTSASMDYNDTYFKLKSRASPNGGEG